MGKFDTFKRLWAENKWGIMGVFFDKFAPLSLTKKLSSETYLKMLFLMRTGKHLNLNAPQTFNEKLQWLKLYYHKPVFSCMVDKYGAKQFVAERIGEDRVIPTLGVYKSFEEIDFDALPNQFVLKCTHDSGGLVICRDKASLDKEAAKRKIEKSLKVNYFWHSREWPYKNVSPQIIAEAYMEDIGNSTLPVYKIFCFGGEPKLIQSIQNDKTAEESIDYFDTNWDLLDMRQNYPNSANPLPRPQGLEEMLSYARVLSAGHPFLRTDFYSINGKVYFSEFTFYSDGGMAVFYPSTWDLELGKSIVLPEKTITTQ